MRTISNIEPYSISEPKGGGAITNLGDAFQPSIFSGTGQYSIPIPVTEVRGFEPKLSLDYNSSNGNGIWGIGFNLSLPQISLRTGKGIPQYNGKDIYINGTEELVLKQETCNGDYEISTYTPRIESAFSLIEHYVNRLTKESFWKITNNENEISFYGLTDESKIYNPDNHNQIFTWLIDRSEDSKGNKIVYSYKAENDINIPRQIWESNRKYTNRYIKSIKYGNYRDANKEEKFACEVIFDYGEYDCDDLHKGNKDPYIPVNDWLYRPDAFSSFLSGFEIRTCRLCSNILLFHHFEEELGAPYLVKRINMQYNHPVNYQTTPITTPSNITELTLMGYKRSGKLSVDIYEVQQMPPVRLAFSKFISPEVPEFKTLKINNKSIPGYLGMNGFQLLDLNNEGIPGLLYGTEDCVYYSESLGHGAFGKPYVLRDFPVDRDLNTDEILLTDLESRGETNLVVKGGLKNGFYEKRPDGSWKNFVPFESYPSDCNDWRYEMAGLSNNGKVDLMRINESDIAVYYSLGKRGYWKCERKNLPPEFPLINKGYSKEYIGFANIFGDGLSHRVRITNGKVECWPDLGYGNFGGKVVLGNAPDFGADFDISRLFLADIDGSGTTDILYVYSDRIELFINNSGNCFSDAVKIYLPEPYSDTDQINFSDILGNGTTCLLFTKADTEFRHYYYNFVGEYAIDGIKHISLKPYLLHVIDNNLGAVTQIHYCSSTKFFLEDKKNGYPWISKLPFPVQLVERKISYDKISKCIYSTHYKYHDGYFDYTERVFKGFGFVESWDTEEFDYFDGAEFQDFCEFTSIDKKHYVPPVYTKTWYHTGAYFNRNNISSHYKSSYFKGDPLAYDLPDSVFDETLQNESSETIRQAYAALSGRVIRTEIYSDDKDLSPEKYMNPFVVEENNFEVRLCQEKGDNEYAVFMVNNHENISYNYERNPLDPRVSQNFVLETDGFGNVLKSCIVYLPRRQDIEKVVYTEQQKIKCIVEEKKYIGNHLNYLYCKNEYEVQKLEISGLDISGHLYFNFDELKKQVYVALENKILYGEMFSNQLQAMHFIWEKIYYWNEEQTDYLPLGEISTKALTHHIEKAVFPDGFIEKLFEARLSEEVMQLSGGYFLENDSGYWWNKGLVQYYLTPDMNGFHMPVKTENSFVDNSSSLFSKTTLEYDAYIFFPVIIANYLDETTKNVERCKIDYTCMKPKEITDINNNTTQFIFDSLGQVIVSSLFGKERGGVAGGMSLFDDNSGPSEYQLPGNPSFSEVINNPEKYLQGASSYFYYNLCAWIDSGQPACSIQLVRQNYWHGDTGESAYCQIHVKYNDGFGRELEAKQCVGSDMASTCNKTGHKHLKVQLKNVTARWRVTGKKVYNNKGKIFAEYLPFFSNIAEYAEQKEVAGEPPPGITHYDPLERAIRVDTSKGFFSKIEFTPWEEVHYDGNDTVIDSEYYRNNYPEKLSPDEKDAIDKSIKFYNTPRRKVIDNTGVVFLDIQNNLGNIVQSLFDGVTQYLPVSSEDILNELIQKGYLEPDKVHPGYIWLTRKFCPYRKGFVLDMDEKYTPYLNTIVDILKQNELTYYYETDISGRVVRSIDPRLYYANINKGTSYSNFIYVYPMEDETPLYVDSADGGKEKYLKDIFSNQFWSFSARNYCQLIVYDRLQRKSQLKVKKITDEGTIHSYDDFNLVENYKYGESVSGREGQNLNGQLYELKDLSGIIVNSCYSMQHEVLKTSRQLVADYHTAINWNKEVGLDADIYVSEFDYNAIKQLERETTPDHSYISNYYDQAGQLDAVHVNFPDGSGQKIVDHIDYSAEGKRNLIKYGNKTQTSYSYEETTHRLISIKTTRVATLESNPVIQDVEYFYDPAGNVTRIRDHSNPTVFFKNQQVEPVLDYTYDALYRLIKASGRQHQGISGNTFKNNISDGSFKQCIYGPSLSINDADKLENYTENFIYDDSTNLVRKQHVALSGSWVKETYTEDDSNRLKNHAYDASGNLKKLDINNCVNLSYNCCENMVKAAIIERPDEPDDSDYYLYDGDDRRTRKVSERMVNSGNSLWVEDKIYLGNFEIKKNYSISHENAINLKSERNTLRIMDDKTCVAIIYYFTINQQNPEKQAEKQVRFQLGNYLGSVSLETDKNAQIITYEEYFPYGGSAILTGSSQSEVNLKEYRYAGKECDDSTGLYYYGARYYAPWLGRWLIPDPAGGKDGLNVYSFVGGNPITATDHDGNWKYIIPIAGTILGTAVETRIGGPFGAIVGSALIGAISTGSTSYNLASSSGKTGASLAATTVMGAALGTVAGGAGKYIATSTCLAAQTLSMMATSTITSLGLSHLHEGAVDVTTSLGAVSYNWSNKTLSYPFKAGNSTSENLSLIAGATANFSDILAGRDGTNVHLVTEFDYKEGSDTIGHSAVVGDNIDISVGPLEPYFGAGSIFTKVNGTVWYNYFNEFKGFKIPLYNLNNKTLHQISTYISANSGTDRLPYSGFPYSCVGYAGDALLRVGVPTLGIASIHPYLLHSMVGIRHIGIEQNPYQTLKTHTPQYYRLLD